MANARRVTLFLSSGVPKVSLMLEWIRASLVWTEAYTELPLACNPGSLAMVNNRSPESAGLSSGP